MFSSLSYSIGGRRENTLSCYSTRSAAIGSTRAALRAGDDQRQRLAQNQPEYVRPLRSERHANPDLIRALGDGI
jgi:hypothetical protein